MNQTAINTLCIIMFVICLAAFGSISTEVDKLSHNQQVLKYEILDSVQEKNQKAFENAFSKDQHIRDAVFKLVQEEIQNLNAQKRELANIQERIASRLQIVDKAQDNIIERIKVFDKTQLAIIKRLKLVDKTQDNIIKTVKNQDSIIKVMAKSSPYGL